MCGAGSHAPVPPLPEPVEADAQQTGNRPPAQPACLLEPQQAFRKVTGKDTMEGEVGLPLRSHRLALHCAEADGQGRLKHSDRRQDVHPQEHVRAASVMRANRPSPLGLVPFLHR